jgi:hypothetical protein
MKTNVVCSPAEPRSMPTVTSVGAAAVAVATDDDDAESDDAPFVDDVVVVLDSSVALDAESCVRRPFVVDVDDVVLALVPCSTCSTTTPEAIVRKECEHIAYVVEESIVDDDDDISEAKLENDDT